MVRWWQKLYSWVIVGWLAYSPQYVSNLTLLVTISDFIFYFNRLSLFIILVVSP